MGDAAPQIWDCKEHGKTGFDHMLKVIQEIADHLHIKFDHAWILAEALRIEKTIEYSQRGDIYFDEDYLIPDLKKKYK